MVDQLNISAFFSVLIMGISFLVDPVTRKYTKAPIKLCKQSRQKINSYVCRFTSINECDKNLLLFCARSNLLLVCLYFVPTNSLTYKCVSSKPMHYTMN